ncbi:ComEA family DNA-binding protein [Saccharibacillus kuerlensis]|uniref:Helix-hairpin-helix DNA-binding motif class 1 domain-containing protein n=1 Tax=Saccharibacillus kuerlensis TaxID=459527 RepID=A0ABQ2KYX4_9BACL|nr:helix-hairpin-helix domain-containing protein [Saccharibacillus kuerlensis]GGN96931.1 hypothetical protein GCM10010969_14350 [Saccharibacillus kuerlensis]
MKKEWLWAACMSAVLGAGVLVIAGGEEAEGLPWESLNERIEHALAIQEGTDEEVEAAEASQKDGAADYADGKSGAEAGQKDGVTQKIDEAALKKEQVNQKNDAVKSGTIKEPPGSEAQAASPTAPGPNTAAAVTAANAKGDIYQPVEGVEAAAQNTTAQNTRTVDDGKIHINSANIQQLMDLPGIGEKKAQAIVDYRTQNGSFRDVTEIVKVKGIGPKMLEKMLPDLAL